MKQLLRLIFVVIVIGFLSTYGNTNVSGMTESIEVNDTSTNNATEQKINQEDEAYMKEKMQTLHFSEIEVEVNYADNKEYEFKVEQDLNEPMEVELDNELANEFLQGRAAFDVIYPKLETLDIKSDTRETEVIDQLLTAFDLPTDYVKMEVDIRFNDGTKMDFEHRK